MMVKLAGKASKWGFVRELGRGEKSRAGQRGCSCRQGLAAGKSQVSASALANVLAAPT
jgi:hypothetical protein